MKNNTFLILGGDNRSLYSGEYLEKQGLKVCYYAFNQTDCYETLSDAISEATTVILPLPCTRDRLALNTPLFENKILLSDILALLTPEKMVFGGQLPKGFCEELDEKGVKYCDYFALDELAVYNAVPTAEGVIQVLMEELPITIHGMNCAVLGYGKVGKILASTLRAMGSKVTVFARKATDFAIAHADGLEWEEISDLKNKKHNFNAIINTVPTLILGAAELDEINPDCLLVEIASAPFGIDFQAAKERALKVIKASSLPGKVAPQTAGEIIGRSVLPIINARGL